ncbi:MAG: polysaccharide biosynthesis tyrosine autokinase [Nocardioidaceae bacterium]|nr:polysaccharide biosynthesis tyrosine autokinase [Nocardioidaceae bacterium]
MELREYLQLLRRRWQLIVVCVLSAMAGAVLFTLQATPVYSSTSKLFISTPTNTYSDPYSNSLFSQERVASYAELIGGEDMARRVVDKLDLSTSPAALSSEVSTSTNPDTVLLNVTVTDPIPARAQLVADAVAKEFTQYIAELETSAGQNTAPIKATIVDSADLPASPTSPRPLRNLSLASFFGLLLGLGLAVTRENLDTTVKSMHDCTEATGTALLGSIRFDAKAAKQPLVSDLDTHAPRVETFRMLRTNLQFIDVDNPSKVFVVTSTVPGEGKSTTAINLAITLSQAQQTVLLIEGDLRRPKASKYLNLEPTVGLTTVLIGLVDDADATQHWGNSGLDVITSGLVPPNPSELLQSQAMHDTLQRLRAKYDFIIIDAPPLLPVTDAALLAAQADGAIIVIRHGKTTKDQGAAAAQRLRSVDARVLGCVLNMTPERDVDEDGYGYGYGPTPGGSATM